MKVTLEMTDIAISKLFGNQNIPDGFRQELNKYMNKTHNRLGCCVLYLLNDDTMTERFRNFMRKFPGLTTGRREIVIHPNGNMDFIPNYSTGKCSTVYIAPEEPKPSEPKEVATSTSWPF